MKFLANLRGYTILLSIDFAPLRAKSYFETHILKRTNSLKLRFTQYIQNFQNQHILLIIQDVDLGLVSLNFSAQERFSKP